jgi:YVTN family beta-propeller protein
MVRPFRSMVVAGLVLAAGAVGSHRVQGFSAAPEPGPALAGNRAPFHLAFSPDGRQVYVTEWFEGTVAVIDAATGRVTSRLPTAGRHPTGLAASADGRRLAVTNSGSASVWVASLSERSPQPAARSSGNDNAASRVASRRAAATGYGLRATDCISLPGMPFDVVLSRDGETAFVALTQLDQVAVIDLESRRVTERIPVGRRPRALAITGDGASVLCANMYGSVSVIDAAARRETARVPIPAVNLRGITVSADGRRAYVTAQRAQNERPTETAVGIWSNQVFGLSIGGGRAGVRENLWLDMAGEGVADPDGIAIGKDALYVSFAGAPAVGVMPLGGVEIRARARPGAGPRGLALSPDGRQLWVANHLGNSVSVLNAASLAVERTVSLGRASRPDPTLYGRYLFESARLTRGAQFSCNSCHPDGHTDGIDWKFVHVKDGVETRNVRSLLGPLKETAPFRWSGHEADLPTFVQNEVTGLLQGPPLSKRDLQAIVAYCERLPVPPNPHRAPGGAQTAAAARGRTLFMGKAGCGECHAGPHYGGTGRRANVGTTRPDLALDVPHLVGVHDSAPYLHDGRAASLEEVFSRYNPEERHGKADRLSPEEMSDLLQFVREL